MKKILTLLAVIVFFITIPAVGGLSSIEDNDPPKDLKKVTIYVKAVEIDGELHLELYDSNDPTKVIDDLVTEVDPGTRVVWRRVKDSGIKKFEKVGPVEKGEIIPEDAKTILLKKRYRARVPKKEIDSDNPEKYIIVFVYKKTNESKEIDPYLKVR